MVQKLRFMLVMVVSFCISAGAMTDYTIGFTEDNSTHSLYTNGFTFTPSIQGNWSGAFEESDKVRINYVEILFHKGSGVKEDVMSANRSVALFPDFKTIAPDNLAEQAIGKVILPWTNAVVVGNSGENTWLRFDFSGNNIILNQDTKYALAFIGENGYAFGVEGSSYQPTVLRTILSPTSTPNAYTGGAVINGKPGEYIKYDPIFRANFTAVPEPATVSLLAFGTLAIIRRRKQQN